MVKATAIRASKKGKKPLTHAQKQFNAHICKIEKKKKILAEWQEIIPVFQKQQASEYTPLMTEYNQQRTQVVLRFHQFFERKSFSRLQKEKMAHLICEWSEELIPAGQEELKAIYDLYSDMSFDEVEEEQNAFAEGMLRDMFEHEMGIDLGDDFKLDMENPEAVAEQIFKKMEAQQEEGKNKTSQKKQTASQKRKATKQKKEEENISLSIKSVYRQLTIALHPDRERNKAEHERKTELMQRVTRAYRDKDLLKLLELQLEVEQIDQHKIDGIADEKLRHFNKVLSRQLEEINMEVEMISLPFMQMAGPGGFVGEPTPKRLMEMFQRDTQALRDDVEQLKVDLTQLTSVKRVQNWLRDYHLTRMNPFDDFMILPPEFSR